MPSNSLVGVSTNLAPSATILEDLNTHFFGNDVEVGMEIFNVTDGSSATVVSVISEHQIQTTPLAGGVDNTWTAGDTFNVFFDYVAVGKSLPIVFNVGSRVGFVTRIIDARWNARQRAYETQRFGIYALYRNAYDAPKRNKYTGAGDIHTGDHELEHTTFGVKSDFLRQFPFLKNMELLYGPAKEIRLLYVKPDEDTHQTQYGLVNRGQVIIGAPLIYPFRRGDIFKIHDKNWMVTNVVFEFWRNKEIIGYRLYAVEMDHNEGGW